MGASDNRRDRFGSHQRWSTSKVRGQVTGSHRIATAHHHDHMWPTWSTWLDRPFESVQVWLDYPLTNPPGVWARGWEAPAPVTPGKPQNTGIPKIQRRRKQKAKKIEHVKTRKIQEKLKNVQIVEPVVPHPPDSSPGHPRGGAWCNMVQQTNIDGRHDMPRRHATTASIIIRMAEDIEDIDGNDSAPQRTASCHVDSHRFTSHVRVWEHHSIPFHTSPALQRKGQAVVYSQNLQNMSFAYFADRSRPNIALLTGTQTPTLRTFSAKCTSDTCPSHVWVSPAGLAFHLLSCWCFCMVHKRGDWSRMQRLRGLKSHGLCVCAREK